MRIALAGLGNVGAGVVRLLRTHADLLEKRGAVLELAAVSARDKGKKRDCDLSGVTWVDHPRALAELADVDIVVEMIGGAEGVALELAKAALASGKHLVTANKAMIAAHGVDLAIQAEAAGLQLSFEAAVCGGMPVLKLLREGLAANEISSIRGILNGTCNFILTRMEEDVDFDAALAEAQKLGYAEGEPSADIDGYDAANKLAILSALAFGTAPDLESVFVEGIRNLTLADMKDAAARGGAIKLIGIASRTAQGITQRVQPVFVPGEEALAYINGAANAIEISGDFVGDIFLQGAGAGEATASAIVADLVDIARGHRSPAFGASAKNLSA